MSRYKNKKETKRIGEQLRLLREKAHWSIEDISSMTGFSRSTISKAEQGHETSLSYIIEIAKAIGVHPREVFSIPFDLNPRYKLPPKRRNQEKISAKIKSLAAADFFDSEKRVADVKAALFEIYHLKANSKAISVVLSRLVHKAELTCRRQANWNTYSKVKKKRS